MSTLRFSHVIPYRQYRLHQSDNLSYPVLDVRLIGPGGAEETIALVDSGAAYCLFNGIRARGLGIDISSGPPIELGGLAGGRLTGRLHDIELEILGRRFPCRVVFSDPEPHVSREILGRHSFFEQVQVAFRERHECLYFEPTP